MEFNAEEGGKGVALRYRFLMRRKIFNVVGSAVFSVGVDAVGRNRRTGTVNDFPISFEIGILRFFPRRRSLGEFFMADSLIGDQENGRLKLDIVYTSISE